MRNTYSRTQTLQTKFHQTKSRYLFQVSRFRFSPAKLNNLHFLFVRFNTFNNLVREQFWCVLLMKLFFIRSNFCSEKLTSYQKKRLIHVVGFRVEYSLRYTMGIVVEEKSESVLISYRDTRCLVWALLALGSFFSLFYRLWN